jgi:hypothetical protein
MQTNELMLMFTFLAGYQLSMTHCKYLLATRGACDVCHCQTCYMDLSQLE